ncbi:MAG: hypothetical protein HRT47_11005 [Candidatus Caenarcaniphilales bacterium]|nr:hypothetical protein [Candidatus Caenarcaniphilales bacterium]
MAITRPYITLIEKNITDGTKRNQAKAFVNFIENLVKQKVEPEVKKKTKPIEDANKDLDWYKTGILSSIKDDYSKEVMGHSTEQNKNIYMPAAQSYINIQKQVESLEQKREMEFGAIRSKDIQEINNIIKDEIEKLIDNLNTIITSNADRANRESEYKYDLN